MRLARCAVLTVAVFAAWPVEANAQGVRVLRANGQLNFREIAEALQVAKDGDVILVGAGDYAPFEITDLSVAIVAAPGADVLITGPVEVRSIPLHKEVVLSGLTIEPPAGRSLLVAGSPGPVRLQDCTMGPGWPSVMYVGNSRDVAFIECSARGLDGDGGYPYGGPGGTVLTASKSTIALYGGTFQGGHGGDGGQVGGDAGHGASLDSAKLYSVGCEFRGGNGGDSPDSDEYGGTWGSGGHGLLLNNGSHAQMRATKLHGGDDGCDGYSGHCCGPPGSCPVAPLQLYGSTADYDNGAPRELWTRPWSPDSIYMSASFDGEPMDVGFLYSGRALLRYEPRVASTWLVLPAAHGAADPNVVLGPTGKGSIQLPIAPWGRLYRRMWLQGFIRDTSGAALLTNPRHVVVISQFRGPDCNDNNIQDYIEVLKYPGTDLNRNLIPDDCEP